MDKEIDKFLEDISNNTPNTGMFDNIDEVEEDLVAGKPFKKLKKDLATDNKREKKTNENI
tara:strand:- start:97 stop:276 length:180 start_codon:yes stop_codon:yes gene_type:complete